jgi:hypothetical protein
MAENKKFDYLRIYSKYLGLTLQMIIVLIFGGFGGKMLDNYLHPGSHLFTVIFLMLSTALSFYIFFKTIFTK